MPFDAGLIGAIHVERLRKRGARSDPAAPNVVFQTSTIDALLDGRYEGDLTFGELAAHGTLGLGTVQRLDGEMVAIDGRFWRADASGRLDLLDPAERTPFAVVVPFVAESAVEAGSGSVLDIGAVYRRIEELAAASAPCIAIRIDGVFPWLRLRSVRRQRPPYRPLAAALADQVEFELHDVEATVVGFRFPVESQGVEVAGYHLHAATADRTRGGHVLDLSLAGGRIEIDPASELHLELPPGVELTSDTSGATRDLLERLEGATGR